MMLMLFVAGLIWSGSGVVGMVKHQGWDFFGFFLMVVSGCMAIGLGLNGMLKAVGGCA